MTAANARRSVLAALSVVAMVLPIAVSSPARAQASSAVAEALFQEGQRLLAAGKTSEACEKLAASQKTEAAVGTLLNLAVCHEKEGKTASAWTEYLDVAALAGRAASFDREKFARKRAAQLELTLSKVRFAFSPREPWALSVDGRSIATAAWNAEVPLDPGSHTVSATFATGNARKTTFDVAAGAGVQIVRVEAPPAPAPEPVPDVGSEASPTAAAAEPTNAAPVLRIAGLVTGGVAVIAAGATAGLALSALSKKNDAAPHCHGSTCDATGLALDDDAHSTARLATITGAFAGVGLAAALTLLVWPSSKSSIRAAVGPRNVTVQTTW